MANEKKQENIRLEAALGLIIIVIVGLCIAGLLMIKPADATVQGQAEAKAVRVSGKLPGRVVKLFVEEGQQVHKGDTIAQVHSSTVDAKLTQAQSMENAASAQSQKAEKGARSQVITGAYNLWQQAVAAETIYKKTYERVQNLYAQGVVSAQKRDEAEAAYNAGKAQAQAAKSQYDLAVEGAQKEDKEAARAMKDAAKGQVQEVQSYLEDEYLLAPCDGEIGEVYPEIGELVGTGTPIASILKLDNMWVSFHVHEDMLSQFTMGKTLDVVIPGLDSKEAKVKVYFVRDMGSYAVWSSTKSTGKFDSKTFEIKARTSAPIKDLRPGMSVLVKE